MTRCGIERADGLIRLAILCDNCAIKAMRKLDVEQRKFWANAYSGSTPCEACYMQEYDTEGEFGEPR